MQQVYVLSESFFSVSILVTVLFKMELSVATLFTIDIVPKQI